MSRFCEVCGTPVVTGTQYCGQCGNPLGTNQNPYPVRVHTMTQESEDIPVDVEYRTMRPAWHTYIWTKDTFLGRPKWFRQRSWRFRITMAVWQITVLVLTVWWINTVLIR